MEARAFFFIHVTFWNVMLLCWPWLVSRAQTTICPNTTARQHKHTGAERSEFMHAQTDDAGEQTLQLHYLRQATHPGKANDPDGDIQKHCFSFISLADSL